ncbi:NXPE family member 3-like [Tachyglossus aculeatus]|uniref:NXPE family member 3-like n=1 Tax=Tachyglossus aculeatus TaxID=9261 RepID=UPI0018F5F83D|nr:NXPE family member 3-like [Tachyglossus aculeatus]
MSTGPGLNVLKVFLGFGVIFMTGVICRLFVYQPSIPALCPPRLQVLSSVPSPLKPLPPELSNLKDLLYWPDTPDVQGDFAASTSPKTSTFHLKEPPRPYYELKGKLEAVLVARDHHRRPKAHGGDLFRARLHSPGLKAGVAGVVQDLENGTYLLSFPLLWAGEAQVEVRLIHSSEAVGVLRRVWLENQATVDFRGYYRVNGHKETVVCNVIPPPGPVCRYRNRFSGEDWFCAQPRDLPCDALVGHSSGSYLKVTTAHEEELLGQKVTNQVLPKGIPPILVNTTVENTTLALPSRSPCTPGLPSPVPTGFYHKDVWHSQVCNGRTFPSADLILDCLQKKIVHMMGDSTLRQWWEYLREVVPSLKAIDLHVPYSTGPLLAIEPTRGVVLQWRVHGWPVRTVQTPVASLHSMVQELEGIAGGPDTVVLFGLGAHFTTFPPQIFAQRLASLHATVKSLLARSPQTLVVVKVANTGYKSVYGSDWFTLQLNRLLKATFSGLPVALLDAWDMTSCHYLPDNIHPGRVIVRNEVDLFLSFVCPR